MDELRHRSFIAIVPPPDSLSRIAQIQSRLKPSAPYAKWERPEKLHITLEFLGEKTERWLDEMKRALRSVMERDRFTVRLSLLGFFPEGGKPRVLWIGSEWVENDPLLRIAATIRSASTALDHVPDAKPFAPHITICREKGKISPSLIQKVETLTFDPVEFTCTDVRLIKSELHSAGSIYTTLFTIPLK